MSHQEINKAQILGAQEDGGYLKKRTGPFKADKRVLKPLTVGVAIIRTFCINCGYSLQLPLEIVENFVIAYKWSHIPTIENNEYIELGGCTVCKKESTHCELKKFE